MKGSRSVRAVPGVVARYDLPQPSRRARYADPWDDWEDPLEVDELDPDYLDEPGWLP